MWKINIKPNWDRIKNAIISFRLRFRETYRAFRLNSPHYGLKALGAFVGAVYMIYLLKCFLTIPVKDYYFDVYTVSPDSIVAKIDFYVGDRNILNTYAKDSIRQRDSCFIWLISYPYYEEANRSVKKGYYDICVKQLSRVIDSTYHQSKLDSSYCPLLETYNRFYHYNHLDIDTFASYSYTHLYLNTCSSRPIGSFPKFINRLQVFSDTSQAQLYLCSLYLQVICDSLSFKKLSQNHNYFETAKLDRFDSQAIQKAKHGDYSYMYRGMSTAYSRNNIRFSYPKHRLQYFLAKEDISQAYYWFYFHSESVDTYTINLHSRGGTIVNNNPSDELQVLSLHDLQITKRRKHSLNSNYNDTDLLLTFPENSNIQYARLFFVTLVIGWLILAFCRNIWKLIEPKASDEV
jgi:hypothetical protein